MQANALASAPNPDVGQESETDKLLHGEGGGAEYLSGLLGGTSQEKAAGCGEIVSACFCASCQKQTHAYFPLGTEPSPRWCGWSWNVSEPR